MNGKDNKNRRKNDRKVNFFKYGAITLLFGILCIGGPILIDNLFLNGMILKIPPNTTFASGEVLAYYGVLLSGLVTIIVLLTSLKAQRKIFENESEREKVNRKIEKRSLPVIDEQFLTGYKLGKYNFKGTPILNMNDSYKYIREHDFKIKVNLDGEDTEVDCFDHVDYRYLVISNSGEYPLFSLDIKIKVCLNDKIGRKLEIEQNINQASLLVGSSLYILVSGLLETVKFAVFHNLGEKENGVEIFVYIPLVEIKCITVTGEKLTIKHVRESIDHNEYITEIKSDLSDEIKYPTYEHENQYIGQSAIKSKDIENIAYQFLSQVLVPKYSSEQKASKI